MDEPIHVSDDTFENAVLKSKIPVIVDFWAPWCAPCKTIAPILEKLAKEYEDQLIIAKVNTDENPKWASRYGVQGIPTLLFILDGKVIHRQVGTVPESILREALAEFLSVASENK